MAYLLTLRVRIYVQHHNSFSLSCSSAVHNCPLKAFEDELLDDPFQFKGKTKMCSLYWFIYLGAT